MLIFLQLILLLILMQDTWQVLQFYLQENDPMYLYLIRIHLV